MAVLIVFYIFVVPMRMTFGLTNDSDFMQAEGGWYVVSPDGAICRRRERGP